MAQTYDSNKKEVEVRGPGIQGQNLVHREFKVGFGYIKSNYTSYMYVCV